jgi:hypothetical protein
VPREPTLPLTLMRPRRYFSCDARHATTTHAARQRIQRDDDGTTCGGALRQRHATTAQRARQEREPQNLDAITCHREVQRKQRGRHSPGWPCQARRPPQAQSSRASRGWCSSSLPSARMDTFPHGRYLLIAYSTAPSARANACRHSTRVRAGSYCLGRHSFPTQFLFARCGKWGIHI